MWTVPRNTVNTRMNIWSDRKRWSPSKLSDSSLMWKYFPFQEQLKEAEKATIRRGGAQRTNANELNHLKRKKRKGNAEKCFIHSLST